LLIGVLVVSWFATEAGMKWGLIAGCVLLAALIATLTPFVRR
jgi:hypothetical protein